MIDGNWIIANLNRSDDDLRAIYSKALNWLAKNNRNGDSRESIVEYLHEFVEYNSLGYLPRKFQNKAIAYTSALLSQCASEFTTTTWHTTPETQEWGGFFSAWSYTQTDEDGLESWLEWVLS